MGDQQQQQQKQGEEELVSRAVTGTSLKQWKVLTSVPLGVMDVCGSWRGGEATLRRGCSPAFPSPWTEASLSRGHTQIPNAALAANFFNTFRFPSRKCTFRSGQGGKHGAHSSGPPLKEWVWAGAQTSLSCFIRNHPECLHFPVGSCQSAHFNSY